MKISALILLSSLMIGLMPGVALGCAGRSLPDLKAIDSYKAVFVGQVTGIHLRDYQEDIVRSETDKSWISVYDYTLPYTVTVVRQHQVRGSSALVEAIVVAGCQVPEPRVRQFGLFFIPEDGGEVIAIYDDEKALYARFATELAIPVGVAYER